MASVSGTNSAASERNQATPTQHREESNHVAFESTEPRSRGPPVQKKVTDLPRLVTRGFSFHQSKNKVRVSHNKGQVAFLRESSCFLLEGAHYWK